MLELPRIFYFGAVGTFFASLMLPFPAHQEKSAGAIDVAVRSTSEAATPKIVLDAVLTNTSDPQSG